MMGGLAGGGFLNSGRGRTIHILDARRAGMAGVWVFGPSLPGSLLSVT